MMLWRTAGRDVRGSFPIESSRSVPSVAQGPKARLLDAQRSDVAGRTSTSVAFFQFDLRWPNYRVQMRRCFTQPLFGWDPF